jgi:hypothetical protein
VAERTLGDVPGIDDLPSNSAVLPASYSYTEVNPLGEVTATDGPLGDLSTGMGSGDPFAYNIGFLDEPQGNGTEGPGYVAQHDPMSSSHLPTYGGSGGDYSSPSAPVTSTLSGSGFTDEQVGNAQAIAEAGRKVGASDRDIQIALMVAMVESGLKNLDYGDRDSVGLFQQRDAWGSFEDRTTPAKSAEMFFLGGQGGQQGLLDIPDRDKRAMGDLAQDVQVSAFPDRYAEHQADAALLFNSLGGETTTGGGGKGAYKLLDRDGHVVDAITDAALTAASKEFGSDFTIMQGSHSTDVAASGNTHAGGGVVDISVPNGDWVGAMTALRKIGFAAWVRNVDGFGQAGSGAHIHAVLIGDEQLSPEALQQVQSYLNNDDGLSGSRPDDGPRQFINNRFVWGKPPKAEGPSWRDQVAKQARAFVGTPFAWGGSDFSGVDTESMLHNIYSQVGVDLPMIGEEIRHLSEPIDLSSAKRGDLIGWQDPQEGLRFGIYLANGQLIEAGGPGRVVQVSELGPDVLNTFGIPIEQLIDKPLSQPHGRPAPNTVPSVYSNPGTVTTTTNPITGNSMVEPNAHVTNGPKPDKHGGQMPGTGGLNPAHPHAPMPGEY